MRIGGRRPEEARVFDDEAGYHQFHNEQGEPYGSFEVFWEDGIEEYDSDDPFSDEPMTYQPGWYWWSCFPGCLPDGEPSGPFGSSLAAMLDADEFHPDYIDETWAKGE